MVEVGKLGTRAGSWSREYLASGFEEGGREVESGYNQLSSPQSVERLSYYSVVCTALSSEVHWLVVIDAFIDNTVREHGLRRDTEDEHPER